MIILDKKSKLKKEVTVFKKCIILNAINKVCKTIIEFKDPNIKSKKVIKNEYKGGFLISPSTYLIESEYITGSDE